METKWLEDFVSLAETRSFSRSAQLRHMTQPAFSRRIQALEAWAGTDLVDRSSYPTRLTPAGETLYAQALEILRPCRHAQHAAGPLGGREGRDRVRRAAHPGVHLLPGLGVDTARRVRALKSRLIALNVHDAVMRLMEGGCDLLIAYHHASQPFQLTPTATRWSRWARRPFRLRKADSNGEPLFRLPRRAGTAPAVPGLRAGRLPGADGRADPQAVGHGHHLERVYETDMAEGLKVMAIEGQAWHSCRRTRSRGAKAGAWSPPRLQAASS